MSNHLHLTIQLLYVIIKISSNQKLRNQYRTPTVLKLCLIFSVQVGWMGIGEYCVNVNGSKCVEYTHGYMSVCCSRYDRSSHLFQRVEWKNQAYVWAWKCTWKNSYLTIYTDGPLYHIPIYEYIFTIYENNIAWEMWMGWTTIPLVVTNAHRWTGYTQYCMLQYTYIFSIYCIWLYSCDHTYFWLCSIHSLLARCIKKTVRNIKEAGRKSLHKFV